MVFPICLHGIFRRSDTVLVHLVCLILRFFERSRCARWAESGKSGAEAEDEFLHGRDVRRDYRDL